MVATQKAEMPVYASSLQVLESHFELPYRSTTLFNMVCRVKVSKGGYRVRGRFCFVVRVGPGMVGMGELRIRYQIEKNSGQSYTSLQKSR